MNFGLYGCRIDTELSSFKVSTFVFKRNFLKEDTHTVD